MATRCEAALFFLPLFFNFKLSLSHFPGFIFASVSFRFLLVNATFLHIDVCGVVAYSLILRYNFFNKILQVSSELYCLLGIDYNLNVGDLI